MACLESGLAFFRFLINNKYKVYVLGLLSLCYLMQQINVYVLVATNASMAKEIKYGDKQCSLKNRTWIETMGTNISEGQEYCSTNYALCDIRSPCEWEYLGTGLEYQLLVGPFFIVLFSLSSIPAGMLAELQNINRKLILAVCVILWSIMTGLGTFATQYWHIAAARVSYGIFAAGCIPFCSYIVAGYYPPEIRGIAVGVLNWSIYGGIGLSFALIMAEQKLGWRYVYVISSVPGIILGVLVLLTVKEPKTESHVKNVPEEENPELAPVFIKKSNGEKDDRNLSDEIKAVKTMSRLDILKRTARNLLSPSVILLIICGGIRIGSDIIWLFNVGHVVAIHHSEAKVEHWMPWITAIFGTISNVVGGHMSDILAVRMGVRGRVLLLACVVVLATPFTFMSIFLPMPWLFVVGQIGHYLIGEMMIGVTVTSFIDLVPDDLTSLSVATALVLLIAGLMPLLLPPIRAATSWKIALTVLYPGGYIITSILLIITFILLTLSSKMKKEQDDTKLPEEIGLKTDEGKYEAKQC